MLNVLLFAVILGLGPAAIAQAKGRSFVGWWIYGGLLFIVALPHALLASNLRRGCPRCALKIPREAHVCPFCHSDLDAIAPAAGDTSQSPRLGLTPQHYAALAIGLCLAAVGCVAMVVAGRYIWARNAAPPATQVANCTVTDFTVADVQTVRRGDSLFVSGKVKNACAQEAKVYLIWLGTRRSDGVQLFRHRIYINHGAPIGAAQAVAFSDSYAAPSWATETTITAYPDEFAL